MSPERPGSAQSEAALAAPRMSEPGSPIAYTPLNNAQSPISILLAVAQSQKVPDDDLTSLSWLHEGDVLKGMNINASPPSSTTSTPVKNNVSFLPDQSPTSDYVDDSSVGTPESSTCTVVNSPTPKTTSSSNHQSSSNQSMRSLNVPYDPQVHVQSKPPYSFSCIIFMAIEDSKQKALPVKEIYAWILDHFPYFKNAPTGWKNSVRHNLSLNKCFQKVEKVPVSNKNLGKGSLWTVDPQYKPNLIESLNRSPFYPCPAIEGSIAYATSTKNTQSSIKDEMIGNKGANLPNPELFPYLSRKLAATGRSMQHPNVKSEQEESLDAADAAAVMLSLKHAARVNKVKQEMQVITTSPSQDHTYSAADSGDNEDEAFESDEDKKRLKVVRRKINFEDDEERRIKEGAETLLNLATLVTNKRSIMDHSDCEPQTKIPRFLDAQEENSCEEQKHVPFQPRMLRVKRKENPSPKKVFNNNQDEWLKHRRELDINQSR